ncbi:MAG: PAS domain S-box protein [Bacteroidetes bacterium]|nr:PAS domain S-box protein [Bacteroidota bacterium]
MLFTSPASNNNFFIQLIEHSPDAILVRDASKKIVSWNKGAELLLGFSKEEAIGKTAIELGMIKFTAEEIVNIDMTLSSSGSWSAEKEYFHKDGSRLFGTVSANAILNQRGDVESVLFIIKDATNKKIKEENLCRTKQLLEETISKNVQHITESDELFRLYISNTPAAIAMFDKNMNYVLASKRWMEDYGLTEVAITGKSHYEIFPEISEQWKQVHQRCLHGASEKKDEELFVRADGSHTWIRWEILPWYHASGCVGGIIIFSEDITQRKLAEDQVIQNEEKYRSLVERISDGFIALDENWNFTYVNKIAETMFTRSADDLLHKNIWTEFPEKVQHSFYKIFFDAMQQQQHQFAEQYCPTLDLWLQVNVYPSDSGLSVFFRDISREKNAERKANRNFEIKKKIMSYALDAIVCTDKNGVISRWTGQAEKLFGWTESEITGNNISELLLPQKNKLLHEAGNTKNNGNGYPPALNKLVEVTAIDKEKREFPVEVFIVSIDESDDVYYCAYIRDISKRKKSEEYIMRNQFRLNQAQHIAHLGNWEINFKTKNSRWSDETYRIYGLEPADHNISQDEWLNFVHPEDKERVKGELEKSKENWNGTSFYHRIIRHDGMIRYLYAESRYEFNEKGEVIGMYGIAHDITDLKTLEQELQEQQRKEQQKLMAASLAAQEKERNSIAKELHDNVNQILVGTKIMMSVIPAIKDQPEKIESIAKSSIENLQNAISENRKIAHELVSPNFTDNTLLKRITAIGDTMLIPAGINIQMKTDGFNETKLHDEMKLTLYRIIQEQCTNIVKYSEARSAVIQLNNERGKLKMTITDDGKGMEETTSCNGIGLRNIKSRLSIYDGKVEIKTAPGKGFSLNIIVPLRA